MDIARWSRLGGVALVVLGLLAVPLRPAVANHFPCPTDASECDRPYGDPALHQTMDVYYANPTAPSLRPAVLFIHGGAWIAGDKSNAFQTQTMDRAPRYLADTTGWVAFNMNYRLAGDDVVAGDTKSAYKDQPDDVRAAVLWIKQNADTYSIDRNRIALVGHSAGGNLALLQAFREDGGPAAVKQVVSWAGPTDMVTLAAYYACLVSVDHTCGDPKRAFPATGIRAYEGGCALLDRPLALECQNRYLSTSPVRFVGSNDPPALLVHGGADIVVPIEQELELLALHPAKTTLKVCLLAPHVGATSVKVTNPVTHEEITVVKSKALEDCALNHTIDYLRDNL